MRVSEKRIQIARYLVHRSGGEVVFFGRFTAILRTYAAFLAGTTRMPWRRFLFFNAAGGIAWATIYGGGGPFVGGRQRSVIRAVVIFFVWAPVLSCFCRVPLSPRPD